MSARRTVKPVPPPAPPPRVETFMPPLPVIVRVEPMGRDAGYVGGNASGFRCPNCEHGLQRHVRDPDTGLVWCLPCGRSSGFHAVELP